jgi:hypothetical protein
VKVIRNVAVGLLTLAVCGLAFPAVRPPAAAAQLPGIFDLNGVWEVEDRGVIEEPGLARVRITHSGQSVEARFVYGAKCKNGSVRTEFFIAELSSIVPGEWLLSSPAMWVCSGSPSEVQKCGGSLDSPYKSSFTGAIAKQDRISGMRKTQFRNGCTPTGKFGETEFVLSRLGPCDVEARTLRDSETALRGIMDSIQTARLVFARTVTAARVRYGDTYNTIPTARLAPPINVVTAFTGDWDGDLETAQFILERLPQLLASAEWKNARDLAAAMAMDPGNRRLPEAEEMLSHMNDIEEEAPIGATALADFLNARRALDACRQAAPRP